MKKTILCLISLCLIIFSCKKESGTHPNPSGKTNRVTFSVGFSQTIVNLNAKVGVSSKSSYINDASPTIAQQVDVIYYGVYDASGAGVHIITQYSTDANFGNYTDDLKPGNYTIVVVAGKSGILLGPAGYGGSASALSTDVISCGVNSVPGNGVYWNTFDKDAFFEKLPLTVGDTDTNINFSLNRITSELVVNINDAIPTGAYNATITIKNSSDRFSIGTAAAIPFDLTTQFGYSAEVIADFTTADYGTKNYQVSTFFLYAATPFSVDLEVDRHTNTDSRIAGKNIPGVTAQVNTETLLSGDLFGGNGLSPTGGFQAVIDTTWSGTTIVPFSVIKSQKIKR